MIVTMEKLISLGMVLAVVSAGHADTTTSHVNTPPTKFYAQNLRKSYPGVSGKHRTATTKEKASVSKNHHQPKLFTDYLTTQENVLQTPTREHHHSHESVAEKDSVRQLHENKNNFIGLNFYADNECSDMVEGHVIVLGKCFEVDGIDGIKSFTMKANNKLDSVIQLVYNNHECKGVPDSFIDLGKVMGIQSYGDCNSEMRASLVYFDSFPNINELHDGVVYRYSTGLDYETCVERYDYADYYRANTCLDGSYYLTDACSSDDTVVVLHYDDYACESTYWTTSDWTGDCYLDAEVAGDAMSADTLTSLICLVPATYEVVCDPFDSTDNAFYPCVVELCGGDSITVNTHDNGAWCQGDQLFNVYAAANPAEYVTYDDVPGQSLCPYFTYDVAEGTECQTFVVDQGCWGGGNCQGQTVISVYQA